MNASANLLLAAVLLLCGCALPGTFRDRPAPGDVLLKADRDFALAAQRQGVANAFRQFAARDAMSLPVGEEPIRGRDAIFKAMSAFPPGELLWQPVGADLARGGDLGYTWGT